MPQSPFTPLRVSSLLLPPKPQAKCLPKKEKENKVTIVYLKPTNINKRFLSHNGIEKFPFHSHVMLNKNVRALLEKLTSNESTYITRNYLLTTNCTKHMAS